MTEPRRYTLFDAEWAIVQGLIWQARSTIPLTSAPAAVVEIGAHAGRTTERLWRECQAVPFDLHVVDPWDGRQDGAGDDLYRDFDARRATWPTPTAYRGADDLPLAKLRIHRVRSHDMTPPTNLALVLHDGDHRDLSDLPTWWAALLPRGVLIVHDVADPGWPAVREAFESFGPPWHEYRYQPTADERAIYGPGVRGLGWKIKL